MQDNDSTIDNNIKTKDKALRLIEYLAALVRINAKIVRSVDEYPKVLWIYEIPREPKYCFTRVWGEEDERGGDTWITVKKCPEPPLPKVPEVCRDWVNHESLRNTKDLPELYETIAVEMEKRDPETGETFTVSETLFLNDHPGVQEAWNEYLEKHWLSWAELYGRYAAVQKVYADLFRIYQELQKSGEQYELVFCFGLLTWRTPSGREVKRHLVAAKASLEFEPHIGKFTVGPTTDGDQVNIELDMLDIEDQPANTRKLIEDGRTVLRDDLWDRSAVDPLLAAIANSLADSGQGEYYKDRLEPQQRSLSDKPIVEYAPALILRKRSMRGLEYLLAGIKEQIEAGVKIPHEFLDLCESLDTREKYETAQIEDGRPSEETEIYFPLLANDEQRRIIRTLNRQRGVLVQGPPGTGKSHTIANLICHLLATGKRVLVTAKTPRALQVLHEKLPQEIKPLCINLLGSGTEEKESLEKSVVGILARFDRWDQTDTDQRIQCLEMQIQANRRAKAEADAKLMALRESETFKHTVSDGAYSGTAAEIARRLKAEEEQFVWFTDKIAPWVALPLSPEEVQCLCRDMVELNSEEEEKLSLFIPDPVTDLPDEESVRALFLQEQAAQQKVAANEELLYSPGGRALLHAERENIEHLLQGLAELAAATESILKRPMPWISQAVCDVLTDNDKPWKELFRLSSSHAEGLRDAALRVDTIDVIIPEDMDRKKLLYDAKALKAHFEAGGGRGFLMFKPKALRIHGGFLDRVKVDGLTCTNTGALEKLIDYLTVEQRLDYIWTLWSEKTDQHNGPFPLQVAAIEELHEALESVVKLYDLREKVTEYIKNISGLSSPQWEEVASLYKLTETGQTVLAQLELMEIRKEREKMEARLSAIATRHGAHPIVGEIMQTFKRRDINAYYSLVAQVRGLRQKAAAVNKKRQMIGRLAKEAPQLANILARCSEPHEWSKRLKNLDKAWAWARAKSWLEEFLESSPCGAFGPHQRKDENGAAC